MTKYVVKAGDTLSALAKRFHTTIEDLMKDNPEIKDPNLIFVGQTLTVPFQSSVPEQSDDESTSD